MWNDNTIYATLSMLLKRLEHSDFSRTKIIPWGSPVPAFGDLSKSLVATLGLNPSNREFVDSDGNELSGKFRRFHTLASLGLKCWADANARHHRLMINCCHNYFFRNPYDGWFRVLDQILSEINVSYYGGPVRACHLDLIPYATACKWTDLSSAQRSLLLDVAGDTLGLLLRGSPVRLLILNGQSVVDNFQEVSGVVLEKQPMSEWTLPRRSGHGVNGYAYFGKIEKIVGINLGQKITVLGFNHNLQSSFGVTTQVRDAIQNWITRSAAEVFS